MYCNNNKLLLYISCYFIIINSIIILVNNIIPSYAIVVLKSPLLPKKPGICPHSFPSYLVGVQFFPLYLIAEILKMSLPSSDLAPFLSRLLVKCTFVCLLLLTLGSFPPASFRALCTVYPLIIFQAPPPLSPALPLASLARSAEGASINVDTELQNRGADYCPLDGWTVTTAR